MDKYDRTLPSTVIAKYVLDNCFFLHNSQIFLNYREINAVYYICHLLCVRQDLLVPYKHLTPDDVRMMYLSYKSVAEEDYNLAISDEGKTLAVANNKEIPQWIFNLVAEAINLTRE